MKKISILFVLCGLLTLSACSRLPEKRQLTTEGKTEVLTQQTLLESQTQLTDRILSQAQGGTLENPVILVNPYQISPLSALIQFNTDLEVPVQMTVKGKTSKTDLTFNFEPTSNHLLPVIGLYPDQPTQVQLLIDGDMLAEYTIQADPIPEDAFQAEITVPSQQPQPNTLIFTTPSSTGYASGYDADGNLRWILNQMLLWDLNLLDNGKITLSTNRLLNSPYYTTGFLTMDLLGHIDFEYSLPGGYHHDLDQLPNGNYLVASDDFSGSTVEDIVVEVDRNTGSIVKTFDLKSILPQDDGKSLNWTKEDWFHNNSVDYNPIQNTLTVSGRHQDAVAVIDYDTQKLKWIIGSPEGWSQSMQSYFPTPIGESFEWQWAQHAATWISETQLMLFDNGMYRSKSKDQALNAKNNYSRLVIYELDEAAGTLLQVYEYGRERGYAYYSPYISDVDQLKENHYLITSGGISWLNGKINNDPGSLTEFDRMEAYLTEIQGDQVIFELKIPANIYRAEKIDVSQVTMTEMKPGKALGSLGVTRFETPKSMNLKLKFSDALPLEHELTETINLIRESNRLMVTATLNKHDNFDILLVNEDEIRIYPVQSDTQPGMCVAVFNSPETLDTSTLIQSISTEGLSGQWHLYYYKNNQLIDAAQLLTLE